MASSLTQLVKGRKWVYALGPEDDAFKIGITTDLEKRLSQYRVHRPAPPKVAWAHLCQSASAISIESYLKDTLLRNRRHGEWFDISRELLARHFATALQTVRQPQLTFMLIRDPRSKMILWIDIYAENIQTEQTSKLVSLKPLVRRNWDSKVLVVPDPERTALSNLTVSEHPNAATALEHVETRLWDERGF